MLNYVIVGLEWECVKKRENYFIFNTISQKIFCINDPLKFKMLDDLINGKDIESMYKDYKDNWANFKKI